MSATDTAGRNPDESADESLQRRKAQWLALRAGPHFGALIAVLRDLRGETRASLVKASGRSYSQVRGLELGDRWPSDKMLTSIAGPLQCTPGNLIEARDDLLRRLAYAPSGSDEASLGGWLQDLPARFGGEMILEPALRASVGGSTRGDMVWKLGDGSTAVFEVKRGTGKTTQVLAAAQQRATAQDGANIWEAKADNFWSQLQLMSTSFDQHLDAQTAALADLQQNLQLELESARRHLERLTSPDLATRIHQLTAEETALVGAYVQGLLDARGSKPATSD